ncbi:TPA: MFS transporter [Candidatus Nomurabacteria bacterium]|nr:MAG: hypothetical protein O210_OD1C00001G0387 [Parcubacteria bacterium RAAC4_OD1_1]HCY26380.1 MFS transporter [Candidatus Nomurabacteria bacterium]
MTNKLNKMYLVSFIFTLHIALSAYVNSTFLVSIMSEKYVGILYTVASLVTLILLTNSSKILKNFGNKKITLIFLFINILSLIGLIVSKNPIITGTSFVLFMSTNTLVLFCIDIFIEHFSDQTKTGKTRGTYLTIINIAWMLSPLISTFIMTKEGGYQTIYSISLIMAILMMISLIFSVKTFKDRTYKRTPFFETFYFIKKNKGIEAIVIINFILQFFFSWMVVYTPLYLYDHIGLNWTQIGSIFTVMLAPFVILGLPVGILIDRYKISKKKLLKIGLLTMIISTSIISIVSTKEVVIWAIILFFTRVGASIIETTSEIYFFSKIKEDDAYLLGIFRDMNPVAYIIGPIIATVILIIFPFQYLFLILGIIIISGFYYVSKLEKENGIPNQNK